MAKKIIETSAKVTINVLDKEAVNTAVVASYEVTTPARIKAASDNWSEAVQNSYSMFKTIELRKAAEKAATAAAGYKGDDKKQKAALKEAATAAAALYEDFRKVFPYDFKKVTALSNMAVAGLGIAAVKVSMDDDEKALLTASRKLADLLTDESAPEFTVALDAVKAAVMTICNKYDLKLAKVTRKTAMQCAAAAMVKVQSNKKEGGFIEKRATYSQFMKAWYAILLRLAGMEVNQTDIVIDVHTHF